MMVSDGNGPGNHLLVSEREGALLLEDLGSRNGTWLLLPADEAVSVRAPNVVVQLGSPSSSRTGDADEPPPPTWRRPSEYATALATAIRAWPRMSALDLEVRILPNNQLEPAGGSIPLATGQALDLVPRVTTDATWAQLLELVFRWVARHNLTFEAEERTRSEGMVLSSASIRSAHREVVDAAQAEARTLLLRGPSGAGKEMLAEVFHRHAGRSGPFIAVNCSMFSKELLRTELFGAEPGSFTGATRRIIGAVERAQGGTLFLDEIGDMPEEVQPMLLRFLDRHEFEPLGHYGRSQRADVRIVAATNKDLREATRSGKFRADLWFRLCVHLVEVPPLRERWDDIASYLETTRVPGGAYTLREVLSEDARAVLRAHAWEGNFRELANFRERLPRGATPGSVDARTASLALERGSLNPVASRPAPPVDAERADWMDIAARATRAFVEDHGRAPATWDDQKEWNEKYLKPLLFHRLSMLPNTPPPADEDALSGLASRAAAQLRADRGTALKQLSRYYERFREESDTKQAV
jgi:DNA-binding NtrC family response regulator